VNKNISRRSFSLSLTAVAVTASVQQTFAQPGFPSKPVTLIVPNAPGGAIDILARSLQQHLQMAWGQSVIVEYKPGAGTALGTDFAAKAAPDGHTLCLVATPHVINPAMRQLPFDTVKDLSGVTILGVSNILISSSPAYPSNNLKDAIELIKKNPSKYAYASPGSGSSMHFAMELLKQRGGIELLHAPFKGSGPAYPEVFSGRIDFLVDPLFSSLPYVKSGKLKPLAVTGPRRSPLAPDIPTVSELYPGFNVQSMFGLVVSSGTPRAVVQKIYADVIGVLKKPEVIEKMAALGLEPNPITPDQFDATIKEDIERWTKLVKSAHIKLD
jgi:tripartite-type tricarboxylate transporter receptor subunit TctC